MHTATDIADASAFTADAPIAEKPSHHSRWADFYELTKPRMNFLIVATTMVGYYMAVRSGADWLRLPHALVGTALTAAAAAVFNQLIERKYDALMPRTKDRPLPCHRISSLEAIVMGAGLAAGGLGYLYFDVNPLTALLGAVTLVAYLCIYTPMKRRTSLNTIIGAIPGALPPVMGWTAVRGQITAEAVALFLILFVWQMPHFLAIAILYRDDYAVGGFKMLPVDDENLSVTSRQILLYAAALVPTSLMPVLIGIDGKTYGVAAVVLGLIFLWFAAACARTRARADARKLFFWSIIYLPVLLAIMMLDRMW